MSAPTPPGSVAIMADWRLRAAVGADVEAIAEVRAVVFRADMERLGRYDEHRVRQRLRDGFDAAHTWVIEVGGTFAGCVALRPEGDTRWLEHFYLAQRLQGRGIGSAVLRELLERCDRTERMAAGTDPGRLGRRLARASVGIAFGAGGAKASNG